MTPLRQRMTEDMQVRNLARNTQTSYVQQVSLFARHFNKSPELLGPKDIRTYQVYWTNEKKLAPGSILIAVSALRFLCKVSLHMDWSFQDLIPAVTPKAAHRSEPSRCPAVPRLPGHQHRAILTTCYAAGLRISEAVPVRPTDIDRQRTTATSCCLRNCGKRFAAMGELCGHKEDGSSKEMYPVSPSRETPSNLLAGRLVDCLGFASRSPRTRWESGTDLRTIQLLLGHRSLATTARYLRTATSTVCSASSPLDLLLRPVPVEPDPAPPQHF